METQNPMAEPQRQTLEPHEVTVGCKLQVRKVMDEESFWREGEVLAIRSNQGLLEFYIHYTNFNKRLDEWVPADRINFQTVMVPSRTEPPKKDGKKKTAQDKKSAEKARASRESPTPSLAATEEPLDNKTKLPVITEVELATGEGVEAMDLEVPAVKSKAEEIESLRFGGSMTQRPEEVHRVKNISHIVIGHHKVETWYFSPYPPEFALDDIVYICEFCLSFYNDRTRMDRHRAKCELYHPPGNEIYRNEGISFFEIDGHRQKTYCRNLCLLSKLFLDHKTLYYDVNPFLFYVMTQNDELGCHIVGYFSKEKESADGYNVACILTLPNHQRKGYGRLLIDFSYELSKVEGKLGSPEKPLSDLGLLSYRSFWTEVILMFLFTTKESDISIEDLSLITSMTCEDILHTMQALELVRYYNGQYVIVLNDHHREQYEKLARKNRSRIDPSKLDWKPPHFTASQLRYI